MKHLSEALKLALITQGKGEREFHKHCQIKDGLVTATDGVISSGCQVEESLDCKPNTELLLAALSKCKKEINITQVNEKSLSVKSGRFKATVPCFPIDLPECSPDPVFMDCSPGLLKSISRLTSIADKSQNEVYKTVFLKGGAAFSTDGRLLVEIWHSGNVPKVAIPADSCKRLLKVKGELSNIGGSKDSITFYFKDGSWFKSPLSSSEFPHIDELLNVGSSPQVLTKEMKDGFRAVAPFCETFIKFESGLISSIGPNTSGKSQYEVETCCEDSAFSVSLFSMIMNDITVIDFNTSANLIYFWGDGMRGALAKGRL